MRKISFVIPVFRNKGSLLLTHQEITKEIQKSLPEFDYEFLFVNDGSDDGSLEELLQIREKDKKVKVIDLSRNFGQVQAITAGLHHATGDFIISLSADLQDPVEKIPEMVSEACKGNEIVICHRPQRHDKWKDKLFASLYYQLMRTSQLKIPEGGFDLFLLSKKANLVLCKINESNRYLHADIFWLGFSVKLIPTIRKERTIGKSQYSFWKRVNSLLVGYLNTSNFPIRMMSLIGIMVAFSGGLYSLGIIYAYLFHNTPFKGWAPLMIVTLIIGGLIMTMLGIIGEYQWRIYDETKKRPYYIIKDIYEGNSD
jgi:dolichol-phosphate mannosyltransferase